MGIVTHGDVFAKDKNAEPDIKLATIAPGYTAGRPQLIFSGETLATIKTYPYMAHYPPVSGDRVMLVKGVILGKIL